MMANLETDQEVSGIGLRTQDRSIMGWELQ